LASVQPTLYAIGYMLWCLKLGKINEKLGISPIETAA
jgi:hypothetical protein